MNKIQEVYSKNKKFHRIINVKEIKERKILINFKKKYLLKLKDYKVNNNLLCINNKIVILKYNLL